MFDLSAISRNRPSSFRNSSSGVPTSATAPWSRTRIRSKWRIVRRRWAMQSRVRSENLRARRRGQVGKTGVSYGTAGRKGGGELGQDALGRDGLLDLGVGRRVDRRRRLVEHDDLCALAQRAREREQAALADGKVCAVLVDRRVQVEALGLAGAGGRRDEVRPPEGRPELGVVELRERVEVAPDGAAAGEGARVSAGGRAVRAKRVKDRYGPVELRICGSQGVARHSGSQRGRDRAEARTHLAGSWRCSCADPAGRASTRRRRRSRCCPT